MPNRKPLIIMTPKSMLRHPLAVSSINDLSNGRFDEILDDNATSPEKISKLLFCSGKIYYELLAEKLALKDEVTAIIRIEQLYPFNLDLFNNILSRYKKASEFLWVQEEPRNMGAWNFITIRLRDIFKGKQKLNYIGRDASPATATGSYSVHLSEQQKIIKEAFGEK
jgi:2-oxoglutarate dehydrogenase E1 component